MDVRPVLPRFPGTRFVTGTAVVLGMSVLAACTSASNPSSTACAPVAATWSAAGL